MEKVHPGHVLLRWLVPDATERRRLVCELCSHEDKLEQTRALAAALPTISVVDGARILNFIDSI